MAGGFAPIRQVPPTLGAELPGPIDQGGVRPPGAKGGSPISFGKGGSPRGIGPAKGGSPRFAPPPRQFAPPPERFAPANKAFAPPTSLASKGGSPQRPTPLNRNDLGGTLRRF